MGDEDHEPALLRASRARRAQATKLNRYVPGEFPWGDVATNRHWRLQSTGVTPASTKKSQHGTVQPGVMVEVAPQSHLVEYMIRCEAQIAREEASSKASIRRAC